MFRNYLVTALRNFTRHKLYSFINIAGLAVGLACAIFIALFIRDELSYDRFVPGMDNVYLADSAFDLPGQAEQSSAQSPFPVGPAMLAQIPQVKAETHLYTQTMTLKAGDRLFLQKVQTVDPGFFHVIHLPLVSGNPAQVFAQPESIVLSQAVAKKLFGATDPVGKTVMAGGAHLLTVTGVLRDLPHNTQLVAEALIPNISKADPLSQYSRHYWLSMGGETFVALAPGSDPARVMAAMSKMVDRNVDPRKEGMNMRGSQLMHLHLTPFTAVHLSAMDEGGMTAGGSWTEVYGFGAIAAMILLIACFNFTNLATARAMMRAREVSLRKVLGARRGQLIVQFLGESVLIALLALVIALAAVEVLLPAFDQFTGRPIAFHYLSDWPLTLGIVAIAVAAGLLGGLYPALVLSGFRPAATLKANTSGQSGSGVLRTGLVVLQFAVSIGLGIAAMVVFAQIRYAETLNLGFNRSNIVVIDNANDIPDKTRESLVRTLAAEPSISGAVQSQAAPFEGETNIDGIRVPGMPEMITVRRWDIAPGYISLYGMKLIAGRVLSRDHAQDALAKSETSPANIVISASAARRFGFTPEQAVGKTVRWEKRPATIVGVLANPALDGPGATPLPLIVDYNPRAMGEISVRVRAGQVEQALAAIDRDWSRFAPNAAIDRHFLSDSFDRLFRADTERGHIFAVFVALAISIACLGLLGLAAFTAERRTKEIGIRKVFGARARDIVQLLLWQFSIPVLIANLIAWPVAWFYLHHWLQGYASRISLNPLYFAAVGLIALLIAWITVAGHAVRVARSNPVRALRYE